LILAFYISNVEALAVPKIPPVLFVVLIVPFSVILITLNHPYAYNAPVTPPT